jgi:hypothetical protein
MAPIAALARTVRCTSAWLAVFLACTTCASAFELITPAEAGLPPGKVPSAAVRGSPTRRPSITVISPSGAGATYSPVDFKVRFSAFAGAVIEPDTVVVTYVKQPEIDITPRIKAFITADGIDIARAEVPPGLHQLWIELKDSNGNFNGREVEFLVIK